MIPWLQEVRKSEKSENAKFAVNIIDCEHNMVYYKL